MYTNLKITQNLKTKQNASITGGQSVFVPRVDEGVLANAEEKQATSREKREEIKRVLFKTNWEDDSWVAKAKDELPWPAFNKDTKTQVRNDFRDNMEWIARITMGSEKRLKALHWDEDMPFDPESESNYLELRQAEHLITLATGVGAVIINKERNRGTWLERIPDKGALW